MRSPDHTLQLLLGLPELLQLRKIFVQYEDFGEAEGSHFRRLRLDLVQNFPPWNSLLDSIDRMFLTFIEHLGVLASLCLQCTRHRTRTSSTVD